MQRLDDTRRWVTERAAGIVRLTLTCASLREDTEGGVQAADFDYAAYVARELILRTLSVASVCAGGELELDETQTTFDWFEGVSDDLIAEGSGLALELVGQGPADAEEWLARLSGFVAKAEAMLDLGHPVPDSRASDEMFASLALARDWIDVCAELGGPVIAIAAP
jgi:hypothetical protein